MGKHLQKMDIQALLLIQEPFLPALVPVVLRGKSRKRLFPGFFSKKEIPCRAVPGEGGAVREIKILTVPNVHLHDIGGDIPDQWSVPQGIRITD